MVLTVSHKWSDTTGAYPSFCRMRGQGVFILCPGWWWLTSSINFTSTHYHYSWVGRGAARVKCLAQEHNIRILDRAWTHTALSRVHHTNLATAPPLTIRSQKNYQNKCNKCTYCDEQAVKLVFLNTLESFPVFWVPVPHLQQPLHISSLFFQSADSPILGIHTE